ncbi:uncharacterized protein LOC112270139 [Brachypodium distachyon]|uniref:uncharacterized protein LOC112270139 n=1 Tax=Brachypodium distachyon TaxID=15368 RepID=UPI000234EBE8|nr:uncharacterized protein LOC112270139 [Brachypodium distachyon]|eukprot:XP_024313669.1 uncharacterized protein LOC112270139 [Brachypodium distachyon]
MADLQGRIDQEDPHKENLHLMPEEQEQPRQSQVAISRAALKGKYARSRPAGWATEERSSTPQDFNMEQHAWRFKPCFPKTTCFYDAPYPINFGRPVVLRKRTEPEEVRNARREKRIALRQKDARHHAKLALRKYNRVNNTKFELLEVRAICLFFEFGSSCFHYNFTAKSEDRHSADAGSTKLFFSEVNGDFRSEKDVLLCCIVGENDAGHCYGCEVNQPVVVHPSSQAYGGGSSTCINLPCSDGSSSDSE